MGRGRKRFIVLATVILVIIVAVITTRCLLIRSGTIGELYDMRTKTVNSITFGSPADHENVYMLKHGQLEAAAEYLLSLEVRSMLLQKRYTDADEHNLEIIHINIGSKSGLRIVLIDSNTLTIQEGIKKESAYRLAVPFDREYFLSFFEVIQPE